MTYNLFIDGGVGTTGLEIRDRLAGRGEFALIELPEERRKDADARAEALNDADFVILCLPDDAAREAVAMISSENTRVIDASSAHRVADGWTYGFAELSAAQGEAIATSKRVSNPGCYPTGFLALLAPWVAAGLLPADWPYSCHAVSGYSGGGKALIQRFDDEPDIAFRSYGLTLGHKHVPEMQVHAGLSVAPLFSPAVVPAYRGMLVEIPLPLATMPGAVSVADLRACLNEHYQGSPLVSVDDVEGELLLHREEAATDRLVLSISGHADGSQARAFARLDNLGKGAGGAAVQNLNIMAGLDPVAGLRL